MVGIHVVFVGPFDVDANGNKIDKNNPNTTINQLKRTSQAFLVIPDASVPNSAGSPTIKAYLEAEAADDYVAKHISNTMIVTYDAGAINSAS